MQLIEVRSTFTVECKFNSDRELDEPIVLEPGRYLIEIDELKQTLTVMQDALQAIWNVHVSVPVKVIKVRDGNWGARDNESNGNNV